MTISVPPAIFAKAEDPLQEPSALIQLIQLVTWAAKDMLGSQAPMQNKYLCFASGVSVRKGRRATNNKELAWGSSAC